MLATFVIGLREGLEAALIVGIIAAFLKQDGKSRAVRQMWLGVGLAVLLCLLIGLGLALLSGALPQRQQEMLETVIGLVAVAMVTWMVLWMRQHSKDLKRDLGQVVGGALAQGTSFALVAMAFLAVVREGVETAVFLVAASQTAAGAATFAGAFLGIAVAVVLGYLIYRGGVKLNLSKFFRITGVVLVLVAGGVLMSSLYHAYEAGWITIGRQVWLDFSSFIRPGSVQESLLTGVLGIRAQLTAIDVLAWLLYVVPMLVIVVWPPRRPVPRATMTKLLLGSGAVAALAAVLLATLVPGPTGVTGASGARDFTLVAGASEIGRLDASLSAVSGDRLTARLTGSVAVAPVAGAPGGAATLDADADLSLSGATTVAGRPALTFTGPARPTTIDGAGTAKMTAGELAALNGGRYPVGLRSADADVRLTVTRTASIQPTVTLDAATKAIVSVALDVTPALIATEPGGQTHRVALPPAAAAADRASVAAASTAAAERAAVASRAAVLGTLLPWLLGVWGVIVAGSGLLLLLRRPKPVRSTAAVPTAATVRGA